MVKMTSLPILIPKDAKHPYEAYSLVWALKSVYLMGYYYVCKAF